MAAAGVGDRLGAVALGQHHKAAACGLKLLDIGVHAPGSGGTERAGGVAIRGFGWTGVVHRMVTQVLRNRFTGGEALGNLGVGNVAGDHHGAAERQPGLHRVLGQFGADFVHGSVEVDLDHWRSFEIVVGDVG